MELGIRDCTYISVKKRGAGNTLRTGQACVPCRWVAAKALRESSELMRTPSFLVVRRKKAVSGDVPSYGTRGLIPPHQKCDAKRPCTTCVNGNKGAECTYEPQRRPRPTTFVFAHRFSGPQIGPPSDLLALSSSSESTSSTAPPLALPERHSTPTLRLPWELSPRTLNNIGSSVVQKSRGTTECVPYLTGFSFTILPSIHFRTIPRPLRVPPFLIPPERMQISSIAESDLDMTLCVFFRLLKFHQVVGLNCNVLVA